MSGSENKKSALDGRLAKLLSLRQLTWGAVFTAFTIYSHLETIVNMSRTIRALAATWRELIALPWILILDQLDIAISKEVAGLLTVLLAMALIVRSAWSESRQDMSVLFRGLVVLLATAVGTLYALFIALPAVYEPLSGERDTGAGLSLEILQIFYLDEVAGFHGFRILMSFIGWQVLLCFVLLLGPVYGAARSHARIWARSAGFLLALNFAVCFASPAYFDFLIFSVPEGRSYSELLLVAVVMLVASPYVATFFLADPYRIGIRTVQTSAILIAVFLLDRLALAFEWIGMQVVQIAPG